MYVYFLPLIACFIGYLTNWIAVKMLFHPKRAIRLGWLTIQGVFPKRQAVLADNLGEMVSKELISLEDLKAKFFSGDFESEAKRLLEEKIEHLLRHRLVEIIPMLKMFLSEELLGNLKALIMEELSMAMQSILETLSVNIERKIDIKEIVATRVRQFSSDKLEAILNQVMKKEFRTIEIIGGVLGFLIGLIQVLLVKLPEWS